MKRFLPWLCAWLIRLPGYTLRLTTDDSAGAFNKPDRKPAIYAFWHNRIALMPLFYERFFGGRVALFLISRSRDGQFITEVASHFGVGALRGSSSRHGMAAMLAAVHAAKDPRVDIGLTPDGPRGPRYVVQPGLIRLAQLTQRPIVTMTYHLGWKIELKSWDRFQIPLPFSTCHLVIGERIFVPEEATEVELAAIDKKITAALGAD